MTECPFLGLDLVLDVYCCLYALNHVYYYYYYYYTYYINVAD